MRKPTIVLELNGAYKKNPARRRGPEPQAGPLGDPPERLPAAALPFWHELVAMAPEGVLMASDRWSVELAARLMEKASRVTDFVSNDRISSAELSTLRSLLGAMGLTPADRSRLSVEPSRPANRFSELARESNRLKDRPN